MLIAVIAGLILLLAGFVGLAWWLLSRRLRKQRQAQRAFYALSEEIIAAGSPLEIAERLNAVLPTVTEASSAQLFLYNRATKCLEKVRTTASPEPVSAPVEDPPEGLPGGAVTAFNERKLLSIPDVRRSPFIKLATERGLPRAAVFVPLMRGTRARDKTNASPRPKGESREGVLEGVLEVDNADHAGYFTTGDQTAFQHLANQIAASLRLQQQQAMREQLFRGEKVAATGQLISGVASELRVPLDNIGQLTRLLADYEGQPVPKEDVDLLRQEVKHASDIVARLVSFSQQEAAAPVRVDLATVLNGLIRFREAEWRKLGLRVQNHVRAGRSTVLGVEAQLEQVLLTLLVHAEQRASLAPNKHLSVATGMLNNRVTVEILYGTPAEREDGTTEPDPFTTEPPPDAARLASRSAPSNASGALGLAVCRGIINNHGGEIRLAQRGGTVGFEVDLPALGEEEPQSIPATEAADDMAQQRTLTLMLVDPDTGASRHLTTMLGARGHRVVPASAEEASELAQRLRFDGVLWAVRSGRGNWAEYQDQVSPHVPAFALMSEGYDQELARTLEQNGGFLLPRPVQETALDQVLGGIAGRSSPRQTSG